MWLVPIGRRTRSGIVLAGAVDLPANGSTPERHPVIAEAHGSSEAALEAHRLTQPLTSNLPSDPKNDGTCTRGYIYRPKSRL